jgi:hypothetical protein
MGVGIGWLADALNDGPLFKEWLWTHCALGPLCINNTPGQTLVSVGISVITALLGIVPLYTLYNRGRVVQLQEEPPRGRRVLIVWLSTGPKDETLEIDEGGNRAVRWKNTNAPDTRLALGKDIEADAQASGQPRWNMWQLLRAVKPHAATLQTLHLLVTADSQARLPFAQKMLKHYFDLSDNRFAQPTLINEHHIADQIAAISQLIAQSAQTHRARDILIDGTFGQKTSSIAAACATLNNPIALQYVSTDPNDPSVKTYQLVYMAPQN